jgi:hypothetical protein
MNRAYKTYELRNSGEAYRRFHSSGIVAGAHATVLAIMRHKLMGGVIALMGAAGIIGCVITFWPG